ncbi:MAG TPA: hypothetical protein DCG12_21265, partial [Planctomycetaceae bacterium]|nr:hypothetical protein [Planctomycetaceae bacterium]
MNTATQSSPDMTRRHFLRGLGVALPLPALLQHAAARTPQDSTKGTQRMLLISNNLGVLPAPFFP